MWMKAFNPKRVLVWALSNAGCQIGKYKGSDPDRKNKLIKLCEIDTLFDVGANSGQYGRYMRELGYKGRIISFEPLKSAFRELQKAAKNDALWQTQHIALGDKEAVKEINVAGNLLSSSILEMLPAHQEHAPGSVYIGKEKIKVKRLDEIYQLFCNERNNAMVKIDTQGYERQVVEGAMHVLDKIRIFQIEMSLVPLYANETLFEDFISLMHEHEFQLCSIENGFSNPNTGQLLQVDGIFVNTNRCEQIAAQAG